MNKSKLINAMRLLWTDKATIINYASETDENGITSSAKKTIVDNVPCRISYTSDNYGVQSKTDNITQSIKLFIQNDIDIKPGSHVIIHKPNGNIEEYKSSGFANTYSVHQEINLINSEEFA